MSQPLHPNLARIAAAYDDVVARASRGELSAAQARSEVSRLVAKDDEGVDWSIDASTGLWMRRKFNGELVFDTPPTYGLATPTAYDLSRVPNGTVNPDVNIVFHEVDETLLLPPSSLRGATRRDIVAVPEPSRRRPLRLLGVVVGVVAAVLAMFELLPTFIG